MASVTGICLGVGTTVTPEVMVKCAAIFFGVGCDVKKNFIELKTLPSFWAEWNSSKCLRANSAMKKKDLDKKLSAMGFTCIGGSKHEKWSNGRWVVMVPRHKEIGEMLARKILRDASNPPEVKPLGSG